MSTCRVARRVASMTSCQNACIDAVDDPALARNVFHYPRQPFLPERAERRMLGGGGTVVTRPLIGGPQHGEHGGAVSGSRGGEPHR